MTPLDLDSGGVTDTFTTVGEQLCLDFINTLTWPGTDKEHEWFDRPGNVLRWTVAAGILDEADVPGLEHASAADPAEVEASLVRIRELRDVVAAVYRPIAEHDQPPPAGAIEALNDRLTEAMAGCRVDPVSFQWTWTPSQRLEDLFRPVLYDAARFLGESDWKCIRACPACRYVLYDRSRNGKRRWCDMGLCGSREKARRYYQRRTRDQ